MHFYETLCPFWLFLVTSRDAIVAEKLWLGGKQQQKQYPGLTG
jgi:hypothetical protein